jgi:hypothetical protein
MLLLAALSSTAGACGRNARDNHPSDPPGPRPRAEDPSMNPDKIGTSSDTKRLADELIATGYIDFFHRLNEDALDRVWGAPDAPASLTALALDPGAKPLARFLAAEILGHKQRLPAGEDQKALLAQVYATALASNFTEMANPWGLPGTLDGGAGEHLVSLGEAAVPALVALLDNATPARYAGSREAMYGNSYSYRVKDLAAFYISRIRNLPFAVDQAPAARDLELEKLKQSLR